MKRRLAQVAKSAATVNDEHATPSRDHYPTFRALLERHRLWLGVLIIASMGAFAYQVFGKAKANSSTAVVERDDAQSTVAAAGIARPAKYVDVDTQDVRIEVGMSLVDAVAALSPIAIDLAPALVPHYPSGESPASGVFWELRDVNLVIRLHSENEVLTSIGYWSERGFDSEAERKARAMVLNVGKRSVLIDPELREDSGVSPH